MQLSRSGHARYAMIQIDIYKRFIIVMLGCMYKKGNVKRFEKAFNGASKAADSAAFHIKEAGLQNEFGEWWAVL